MDAANASDFELFIFSIFATAAYATSFLTILGEDLFCVIMLVLLKSLILKLLPFSSSSNTFSCSCSSEKCCVCWLRCNFQSLFRCSYFLLVQGTYRWYHLERCKTCEYGSNCCCCICRHFVVGMVGLFGCRNLLIGDVRSLVDDYVLFRWTVLQSVETKLPLLGYLVIPVLPGLVLVQFESTDWLLPLKYFLFFNLLHPFMVC